MKLFNGRKCVWLVMLSLSHYLITTADEHTHTVSLIIFLLDSLFMILNVCSEFVFRICVTNSILTPPLDNFY